MQQMDNIIFITLRGLVLKNYECFMALQMNVLLDISIDNINHKNTLKQLQLMDIYNKVKPDVALMVIKHGINLLEYEREINKTI